MSEEIDPKDESPAASAESDPSSTDQPLFTFVSEELNQVTRERDQYLDQLQRSRAEFANYQKRIKSQIDSDRAFAVANLSTDLLNAIDNFERALEAARAAGAAPIIEGLTMVHKQLLEILAKHEVVPIQALGTLFNPNEHEAIAQKPDPSVETGTVVAELARGYKIRDRVLRPTKVVVSTS